MARTKQILKVLFPGRLRKVVAPALLLIVNLYLYANSSALFGQAFAAQWSNVFLFYVLMALGAAAIAPFLFQRVSTAPLWLQLALFAGGAAGVYFLVALLGFSSIGALKPTITFTNAAPAIALEISTGATEEVFFRGALGEKTGPIVSSLAFGAWHLAAYGADPIQIAIAVVLGFVLWFIWFETKDQFGNSVNGAVHVGLNLAKVLPLVALIP